VENWLERRRMHVPLLDVDVTPLTADEVCHLITEAPIGAEPFVIGNFNLHAVYLFHSDPEFRRFCTSADALLIDGWPVWLLAKLAAPRKIRRQHRIGSTEWLQELLDRGDPVDVAAVGGTPEAARGAEERVTREAPSVRWHGYDGYTDDSDREGTAKAYRAASADPDLLLVGMGMPLQERWIDRHKMLFGRTVIANVGGCIDYLAGIQPLAPRWLGRVGLEWLYRLVRNPARLSHRYLVEPWVLTALLLRRHTVGKDTVGQAAAGRASDR
jgi:N-acetylglucosaminyldiphosphoundecaprenol N-acetyl-beta-D-mannosaminyltransferase